ncbi:MAG: phenylacetic acid degradation protein [Armatimonadetes bacterium]|nr:phenylacetic acid degradation protein [Armatimonadota bacterium]
MTYVIDFASQKWHETLWVHKILLFVPKGAEKYKTAILYITGDGPKKGDYVDLNLLSAATGMPIAMLFNIPNQPLWDMKEDDLIAHTFEKFLDTKDDTWPLLFPMTKAAVSSMNVVQKVAKQNGMTFDKFVVTGASKRGWTTWLTAASGDKRIAGIAPMVFDNLKFDSQMEKQMKDWGQYSDMIKDYTHRGLQAKLETPDGAQLMHMVDPYSYRDKIKVPTLIVNGTNDPYWTVNSTSVYWKDLHQPKWLLEVPNSGHGLEDKGRVVSSVGAFARSLSGQFKMPKLGATMSLDRDHNWATFKLDKGSTKPDSTVIWKATSDTKDFRPSKWEEARLEPKHDLTTEFDPNRWTALFVEAKYKIDGKSFTLSTPIQVVGHQEP